MATSESAETNARNDTKRRMKFPGVLKGRLKCSATRIPSLEDPPTKECIEVIKNCLRYKEFDIIIPAFERLKLEFDKNYESRIFAAENGAYDAILQALKGFDQESKVFCLGMKTMIRLISCRPNLLNEEGIEYQMSLLKTYKNLRSAQLVLRWIKQCCIKSEKNRRGIFNAEVIDGLRNILENKFIHGSKLQDVCSLLRALTLDDDPDFDYGSSIERARVIANDTLVPLTILLDRFRQKKKVVEEILRTLMVLLVQNEFSKKVEEADGPNFILEAMRSYPDDENLNCLILRLIKILTANNDAKERFVALGAAPLIVAAMSRIQTGAIAVSGLSCMAAVASGSPRNSRILYGLEAPGLIIESMKRYPSSMNVQSCGARALAGMGMAGIDPEELRDHGVEAILEIAMKIHGDEVEGDVRLAFANLGLGPELKDHWTKIPGENKK